MSSNHTFNCKKCNAVIASGVTSRVWRGILIMWRNPELVTLIKTEPFTEDGGVAKYMPQKNLDCVLAAVDWARRKEAQQ